MNAFAADHPDEVAVIDYHPWWTSINDPFYQHDPTDNTGRVYYYYIPGVPYLLADGVLEPGFLYDYSTIEEAFLLRSAVDAPVSLSISGSFDATLGRVVLLVEAIPQTTLPAGDYRLQIVLTESDIYFPADNGIDWHHHTMRRMIPDFEGSSVALDAGPAQVPADFLLDPLYIPDHCDLVCFVQENGSHEVLQAAMMALSDLDDGSAATRSDWGELKTMY